MEQLRNLWGWIYPPSAANWWLWAVGALCAVWFIAWCGANAASHQAGYVAPETKPTRQVVTPAGEKVVRPVEGL